MVNDVPLYVSGSTGKTVGFNNQCVTDISAGVDGSIWALSCEKASNGDYLVIKWSKLANKWFYIPGKSGVKISAFNEISVAVVDSNGLIYISQASDEDVPVVYTDEVSSFLSDSKILAPEERQFLSQQFDGYIAKTTLCYRASENSFSSSAFHTKCDSKGATITIVKSKTYNKVFGAYTSVSWGKTGYNADTKSFIFSATNMTVHPVKNIGYA